MRRKKPLMILIALEMLLVNRCTARGTCESPDARVLIFGAGMSGVSAGRVLYDKGLTDFIILEARGEVGGRMRSTEFAGVKVELGANWIMGVDGSTSGEYKDNPIWALKRQSGLRAELSNPHNVVVYNSSGAQVPMSSSKYRWADISTAYKKVAELSRMRQASGEEDLTLRDALALSGWVPSTPEDHFVDWYQYDRGEGPSPSDVSLYKSQGDMTYKDFGPDAFYVSDQRGFAYLVEYLGEKFIQGAIRFNTRVLSIRYSNSCVCADVTEKTGAKRYCGRYGISTFSLGVLQSKEVSFNPKLPKWKTDAINMFGVTMYLKVFVQFNTTFWNTDVHYVGRVTRARGDYPLFIPLNQVFDQHPHVLIAVLAGDNAYKASSQDPSVTKQEVLNALKTIYGTIRAEMVDILVPSWASDPLYRGAYSYPKVHANHQSYVHLAAPVGSLFFAGEATCEEYFGYVHGAYTSGVNTANAILQAEHVY